MSSRPAGLYGRALPLRQERMNVKTADSRTKIIEAARTVVSRMGVDGTTLQMVADAAGISKGALYYYYKTKDDILYDIMERDNAESYRVARELARGDFNRDEVVREIAAGVLSRIRDDEKNRLNLHLEGEALQGNQKMKERYRNKYGEWLGNVETVFCRLMGVEKGPRSRLLASFTLGAIEGMCLQKIMMGEWPAGEEELREFVELLLRGENVNLEHWLSGE